MARSRAPKPEPDEPSAEVVPEEHAGGHPPMVVTLQQFVGAMKALQSAGLGHELITVTEEVVVLTPALFELFKKNIVPSEAGDA